MNKNEIIIYKWCGYGWEVWDRRIVLPMSRPSVYNKDNPMPSVRQRPCWWHCVADNKQTLATVCPDGYRKGRLPSEYKSAKRRHPCAQCGRVFYKKKDFIAHECINAK